MKLRVFIPFFNAEDFLERCLSSVVSQERLDWTAHTYNDSSNDLSGAIAKQWAEGDSRIFHFDSVTPVGMLGNFERFLAQSIHDPEDVIVQVDGDDWLPDPGVFSRVAKAYCDENVWITYGNFLRVGEGKSQVGYCEQVPDAASVRNLPWTSTALRTFKVHLARKIKPASSGR